MTRDQIENLAQIGADVACFRDFVPEMTRRIKALEQEFKELRQKVKTQDALIEALQKLK